MQNNAARLIGLTFVVVVIVVWNEAHPGAPEARARARPVCYCVDPGLTLADPGMSLADLKLTLADPDLTPACPLSGCVDPGLTLVGVR